MRANIVLMAPKSWISRRHQALDLTKQRFVHSDSKNRPPAVRQTGLRIFDLKTGPRAKAARQTSLRFLSAFVFGVVCLLSAPSASTHVDSAADATPAAAPLMESTDDDVTAAEPSDSAVTDVSQKSTSESDAREIKPSENPAARTPVSLPASSETAPRAEKRSAPKTVTPKPQPIPMFLAAGIGLVAGLGLAAPSVVYASFWWAATLSPTDPTASDDNWAPFLALGTTALSVVAVGFFGASGVVLGATIQRAMVEKNPRPIAAAIGAAILFGGAGSGLAAASVAGARNVDPLRLVGLAAGTTLIAAAGPAALAAAVLVDAAQEE